MLGVVQNGVRCLRQILAKRKFFRSDAKGRAISILTCTGWGWPGTNGLFGAKGNEPTLLTKAPAWNRTVVTYRCIT